MPVPSMNRPTSSGPRSQSGNGGIENVASSRRSETSDGCRSARTPPRTASGAARPPRPARRARRMSRSRPSSVARARCSALLTDATEDSSSSATSLARQCRTSRRMSTARWRGGSCCSAATNASRSVSRDSATWAGSASAPTRRAFAIGWTHACSGRPSPSDESAPDAGPRSIGCARRCDPCSMSRQTLLAIRYSQLFSAARACRRSAPRHARTIVSCTASSASEPEPSIR